MEKPKPYRSQRRNVAASVHMHEDCFAAVEQFAKQSELSISGAIHKLLRTHPAINLPELQ